MIFFQLYSPLIRLLIVSLLYFFPIKMPLATVTDEL